MEAVPPTKPLNGPLVSAIVVIGPPFPVKTPGPPALRARKAAVPASLIVEGAPKKLLSGPLASAIRVIGPSASPGREDSKEGHRSGVVDRRKAADISGLRDFGERSTTAGVHAAVHRVAESRSPRIIDGRPPAGPFVSTVNATVPRLLRAVDQ